MSDVQPQVEIPADAGVINPAVPVSPKKGKNPFAAEAAPREWHDRLGKDFWLQLKRSTLVLEELDQLLVAQDSPCPGYQSQAARIPGSVLLVSVLDSDDLFFLPKEWSLAAVQRGVSVEQYVGQWRGNLLDAAKGRMQPGQLASNPFQILPWVNTEDRSLDIAIGAALAMRQRGHAKLVVLPLPMGFFDSVRVSASLQMAANNPAPLLLVGFDPAAQAVAEACGLRTVVLEPGEPLDLLKSFKGQVDRCRQKREPMFVVLPSLASEQKFSEALSALLDRKGWSHEFDRNEIISEIQYGIERARMIPAPPKSAAIQDVWSKVPALLEAQWKDWRRVHGK